MEGGLGVVVGVRNGAVTVAVIVVGEGVGMGESCKEKIDGV